MLAVRIFVGALSYATKSQWLSFLVLGDDACSYIWFVSAVPVGFNVRHCSVLRLIGCGRWRLAGCWFTVVWVVIGLR